MGQCCSCVGRAMGNSDTTASDEIMDGESVLTVHSIDVGMSAPSIRTSNGNEIAGHGLALADVPVEQERAYWEWRVKSNQTDCVAVMFGVSNKRNSKFFEILAESSIPPEKHGTKFMCNISTLIDGDVIGVVVQQSEIPMIQLYVNGELRDGGQVSRFRGTVFPSVYLPTGSAEISAIFLYREDQFIHGPPSPGLDPLIAERSLM